MFIAATAALATSCATLRGGNFIYNEATDRVERMEDFEVENNVEKVECKTNKHGIPNCYDKEYINKIGVDNWIEQNKDKLNGSCMFDRQDDFLTKVIAHFTKGDIPCEDGYIPVHAAPIFKDEDGVFKILQVEAPKVYVIDLKDYLKLERKDSLFYIRDFDINDERYVQNVKQHIGKPYGFLSAIQSASDVINVTKGIHCSEIYAQEIQKEGILKTIDPNKITPHTLLHLMANNHFNNSVIKEDNTDNIM